MGTTKSQAHGRKQSRVDAFDSDFHTQQNQAILIGLAADLPGVSGAISRIHIALRDNSIFESNGISIFHDPTLDSNRIRLQQHLQQIAEDSRKNPLNQVLLLFVGHGEYTEQGYRLLCSNRTSSTKSPITPENAKPSDWLEWSILQGWLNKIHARNLLLLMDSCESGHLISQETHKWLQQQGTQNKGPWVLMTGSSDAQNTWERDGICFFTESLAEGLEGWGGRNNRGAVDIEDLFRYLQQRVRARAYEAGVQQQPNRLMTTHSWHVSMELTLPDSRIALDDLLKSAIQQDRCLLWIGERLPDRAQKGRFPERLAWPGEDRAQWIKEQDQLLEVGSSSTLLAKLQLPLLDTGFDSLILQAFQKQWPDTKAWSSKPDRIFSPTNPILLRPSGSPGTGSFCFLSHLLEERFRHMLDWIGQASQTWDTLLIMGLAPEDSLTEQWLALLAARFAPQVWLVFPYGQEHELVAHYESLKIRLLFAEDRDVLNAIRKTRTAHNPSKKYVKLLPLPPQEPWKETTHSNSPYPGLVPFSDVSYNQFFGRSGNNGQSGELQSMREDVHSHRKLILYGDSGNGKTSLLRAALLHVLREVDGFITYYTDTEEPLAQLSHQLQQEPGILDPIEPEYALERAAFIGRQRGSTVVICIDQIERAFLRETEQSTDQKEQSFSALFAKAVEHLERAWPLGQWVLLLSIRKDQLALLQKFQKEWHYRLGQEVQLRELKPLTQEMAKQAITAPLPPSISFDPTLLQHLMEELHTQQNRTKAKTSNQTWYHPPLLQLVCRELYASVKSTNDSLITLAHYERADGLEGLLQKLYQRAIAQLTASQIRIVQAILIQLINRHGMRKRRAWKDVLERLKTFTLSTQDYEKAREVLTSHRIIRQVGQDGKHFIELSHDLLTSLAQQFVQQEDRVLDRILDEWENIRSQGTGQNKFSRETLRVMQETTDWPKHLPRSWQKPVLQCYQKSIQHYRIWTGIWSILLLLLAFTLGGAIWVGWRSRQAQLHDQEKLVQSEKKAQQLKVKQGKITRQRLAEVLIESTHTALLRKNFFKSYTQLFTSLTLQDSSSGRFLWRKLRHQPLFWKQSIEICFDIVFSPTGKEAALGCLDRNLYIIDPFTREKTQVARHKDQILSVAYSPDGKYLASGSRDGNILLYDRHTKKQHWLRSKGSIWSILFSPDSQILVSSEHGGNVRFWDMKNIGSSKANRSCHKSVAWSLSFRSDGEILASAHGLDHLCIWDVQKKMLLRKLGPHKGALHGAQFSNDDKHVYTADKQHFWIWNWKNSTSRKVKHGHNKRIHMISHHPLLPLLATASWDNTIRIWDTSTDRLLHVYEAHDRAFKVAFHPIKPWLLSLEISGRTIHFWDMSASSSKRKTAAHSGFSFDVDFHPQKPWIASGGADKVVRIWDRRTGQILRSFYGHKESISEVRFHPQGKLLASSSSDGTVRLWNPFTGSTIKIFVEAQVNFQTLAFHSRWPWILAAGRASKVFIWNWKTGAKVEQLEAQNHNGSLSAVFHPTQAWLAFGGWSKKIYLWDLHTGKKLQVFKGHKGVISSLQWSFDGNFLFSGSGDKTLRRWDPSTGKGKIIKTLPSQILSIAHNFDHKTFLVSCANGSLYLWKEGSSRIHDIQAYPRDATSGVFSPHGEQFATAGGNGSIQLWHLRTQKPAWKSPLLQRHPLRLMTHLGWKALLLSKRSKPLPKKMLHTKNSSKVKKISLSASSQPSTQPAKQLPFKKLSPTWHKIQKRAKHIELSPDQKRLCLFTKSGDFEAWELKPLRRRWWQKAFGMKWLKQAPSQSKLRATNNGCLFLQRKRLFHGSWKKKITLIHSQVSAFNIVQEKLVLMTRKNKFIELQKGSFAQLQKKKGIEDLIKRQINIPPTNIGKVTALTIEKNKLTLGYHNGKIETIRLKGNQVTQRLALTGMPRERADVTHLIAGPPNTIIAGFRSGFVGHWSITTGEPLFSSRLNGPIAHLLYLHKHLIAATQLNASLTQDLSVYSMPYCQLWRKLKKTLPLYDPKKAPLQNFINQHPCLKKNKKL